MGYRQGFQDSRVCMSHRFYLVAGVAVINLLSDVFSKVRPVDVACDECKSFFTA